MTDVLVIVVLRILWICENNKTWRPHSILWQYTVSKCCLFLRNRMKEDCSTTPLPPTRELPNLDVGNQQSVLIFANGRKNTIAAKITKYNQRFFDRWYCCSALCKLCSGVMWPIDSGKPPDGISAKWTMWTCIAMNTVRREEYMMLRRIEVNPDSANRPPPTLPTHNLL